MPDYKRLVSYIYNYENGIKRNNVGYVRIEARNGQCKYTLHITAPSLNDKYLKVYLVKRRNSGLEGIQLGTFQIKNGVGDYKALTSSSHIMNTPYSIEDMGGVVLFLSDIKFFATEWDDIPITKEVVATIEGKPSEIEKLSVEEEQKPELDLVHSNELVNELFLDQATLVEANALHESKGLEVNEKQKSSEDIQGNEYLDSKEDVSHSDDLDFEKNLNCSDDLNKADDLVSKKDLECRRDLDYRENLDYGKDLGFREDLDCRKDFDYRKDLSFREDLDCRKNFDSREDLGCRKDLDSRDILDCGKDLDSRDILDCGKDLDSRDILDCSKKFDSKVDLDCSKDFDSKVDLDCSKDFDSRENLDIRDEFDCGKGYEAREKLEDREEDREQQESHINIAKPIFEEHALAKRIFRSFPRMYPFEDNEIAWCVRIEPRNIGLFPMEAWVLGNNSFLLHGYYSHHHLIFARINDKNGFNYILGVPGIYHNREKFMANMFGFENFKSVKRKELKTGEFGYWYIPIVLN